MLDDEYSKAMKKISKYIDPQLVAFLKVTTRDEAVRALVDIAFEEHRIYDKNEFYSAIISREKIVSTGIGMAVAIPHAKLSNYDHFFITIGILSQGIDWNTIDGSLVRIIFMIGGPDDKQTEYLQILSGITSAVKDEAKRKQLIHASSQEQVIELLKEF